MTLGDNRDQILDVMELIQQPMFLLQVQGPETFVFRGLNGIHQNLSGLSNEMVVGKTPHDAFPQRLADTVVQNYEICRASGEVYTYEEILELPTGPLWWQTTLSPVFDDQGNLSQIVGLAFDITPRKDAMFGASQKLSEMTRLNEDLQVFASTTAQDMQGPFQTMIALIDMVMDGFVDLGDEKGDQLALCSEIAHDAIASMSGILATAQGLKLAKKEVDEVDMGHVASDIAALLDPHQRLSIELPSAHVTTDRVAMQMVLRNLMENAVRYADKKISVSVAELADDPTGDVIAVTVSDDGVGRSAGIRSDGQSVLPTPGQVGADFGLNSALAIVAARGGRVVQAQNNFTTGAAIQFTLPGAFAGTSKNAQQKEGSLPKATPFQLTGYTQIGTGLPSKIRPT